MERKKAQFKTKERTEKPFKKLICQHIRTDGMTNSTFSFMHLFMSFSLFSSILPCSRRGRTAEVVQSQEGLALSNILPCSISPIQLKEPCAGWPPWSPTRSFGRNQGCQGGMCRNHCTRSGHIENLSLETTKLGGQRKIVCMDATYGTRKKCHRAGFGGRSTAGQKACFLGMVEQDAASRKETGNFALLPVAGERTKAIREAVAPNIEKGFLCLH